MDLSPRARRGHGEADVREADDRASDERGVRPDDESHAAGHAEEASAEDAGDGDEREGASFAGGENELSEEEARQVRELRDRDREVRAHEQTHAGVGGSLAGPPQYEYERGPDGRAYAVSGEVPIRLREGRTPEETARLAQRVQRAALAPASPSSRDRQVAAEAAQMEREARAEAAEERAKAREEEASASGATPEGEAPGAFEARATDHDEPASEASEQPAARPLDEARERFAEATEAYARVLDRERADRPPERERPPSFSSLA